MIKNIFNPQNSKNIKYADNAWQCYGTTDRNSVFTSESILDLIYAKNSYSEEAEDYIYAPRLSGPADMANLAHDLILVYKKYYQSTNLSSFNSIKKLGDFLTSSITIVNPVYNPLSKIDLIKLIDLTKWLNINNLKVSDFLGCLVKDFLTGDSLDSRIRSNFVTICNIYLRQFDPTVNPETKLATFAANIINNNKQQEFEEAFSLRLHDQKSVKFPFYINPAAETLTTSNSIPYMTRVLANATMNDIFLNIQPNYYIETITDSLENNLSSDPELIYTYNYLEPTVLGQDYSSLDVFNNLPENSEIKLSDTRANTLIRKIIENNETTVGGYSSYIPQIFIGEAPSVSDYPNSSGIHLIQNYDKASILLDETADLYEICNGLIIGGKYVDALITQRTFLGSLLNFLAASPEDLAGSGSMGNINLNTSLKCSYSEFYQRLKGSDLSNDLPFYYSINALVRLNYLGHTGTLRNETTITDVANLPFIGVDGNVKKWLENETFLIKTPIYGDYIESIHFDQNLNPEADVSFKNLRLNKSSKIINPYDDSKLEIPYVRKTGPLINLSKEDVGNDKVASESLPGLGNFAGPLGNKTSPAFLYDFNKGDESDNLLVDNRSKTNNTNPQRVRSTTGNLVVEGEVESQTIDEIWTAIKLLFESSGHVGSNRNLPIFFGTKASSVNIDDFEFKRRNPKAYTDTEKTQLKDAYLQPNYIDILDWEPTTENIKPFYNPKNLTDFQYKGYEIKNYIPKIIDYKVSFFGRKETSLAEIKAKDYEYETETGDYDEVYNYLTSLLNQVVLTFDGSIDTEWNDLNKIWDDNTWKNPTPDNTSNQQLLALSTLNSILDYESPNSLHNHYKQYLANPKNLKTIERDLETLRQNLQTLSEYITTTSVIKGSFDRKINRGTLHTLHRNNFEFNYALLTENFNTLNDYNPSNTILKLLEDDESIDNKVVYKDGDYINRYKYENFDAYTLNIRNGNDSVRSYRRDSKPIRSLPNSINSLSEVYLGLDGLYHSIHEYTVLPLIECEY